MIKIVRKKYEENDAEILKIAELEKEEREVFAKLKLEYSQKIKELLKQKEALKAENKGISKEFYVFSYGEVLEEISKVAREHGYSEPDRVVAISATVWNSGKRFPRTVEGCRKYLEDPENKYYAENACVYMIVNRSGLDSKKDYFCFKGARRLNFDMVLCDGSRLEDNLYTRLGYDDVQGCYYTDIFLKDEAKKQLPVTIDPTNYPRDEGYDNKVVFEAFENLRSRRDAELAAKEQGIQK